MDRTYDLAGLEKLARAAAEGVSLLPQPGEVVPEQSAAVTALLKFASEAEAVARELSRLREVGDRLEGLKLRVICKACGLVTHADRDALVTSHNVMGAGGHRCGGSGQPPRSAAP